MQNLNIMISSFEKLGYNKKMKIKYTTFCEILDDLLTYKFDIEVASQLWQQASINENDQAEVQQLCTIILKAQELLREKIQQTTQNINNLVLRKKQIQNDLSIRPNQKINEIKKITSEIQELKNDKNDYSADLKLVTQPFKFQMQTTRTNPVNQKSRLDQKIKNQQQYQNIQKNDSELQNMQTTSPNDQLKWILWITLLIFLFQIIFAFAKYNFLNFIICTTILCIFLLTYFDTFYMTLCFGLTIGGTFLDILWCGLYATSYWNPPLIGVHSQGQSGYLKMIIIFTIITVILKIPLMILLYRNRIVHAETSYNVVLFGRIIINLNGNKKSAITEFINGANQQ